MAQCVAKKPDGARCRARAMTTDDYCFMHAPYLAERRRAAQARGGQNSATARRLFKLAPPEIQGALTRLLRALEETHEGALDARRAAAMAAVARAIAAVYQQAELAARLEALEQRLDGGDLWTSFGD